MVWVHVKGVLLYAFIWALHLRPGPNQGEEPVGCRCGYNQTQPVVRLRAGQHTVAAPLTRARPETGR